MAVFVVLACGGDRTGRRRGREVSTAAEVFIVQKGLPLGLWWCDFGVSLALVTLLLHNVMLLRQNVCAPRRLPVTRML
jgi:hypothetical protein